MKSYKEMGQDAKNKRRSKPSGRVRNYKPKQKKTIKIECRYIGIARSTGFFNADFFNPNWHDYFTKYATLKAAKEAVKTLNKTERNNFEYRLNKKEDTK